MLRTAVPFGSLLIYLFLLVGFALGVTISVYGWRRHMAPARWFGAGLCVLITAVVAADAAFDSALEWNPQINTDAQVFGTWADRSQKVLLASDHTFLYQTATQTVRGTWRRNDWTLYLNGGSYTGEMQFLQFRGRYRLLTHPLGDPDTWDSDLGLPQTQRWCLPVDR